MANGISPEEVKIETRKNIKLNAKRHIEGIEIE